MSAAQRAALWRLDVKGAEVRAGLAEAGVASVLLKGPAFAALLYADGSPRGYADCDLLISASQRDRADECLAELGFFVSDRAIHAVSWHRLADGMAIDLHESLPLLEVDPQLVWTTLSARAVSLEVGGEATRVLDPAAAALLTALHLVHHGPRAATAREDLTRAIDQFNDDCWRGAAALATALGAEALLGTGLRLIPSGVKRAERLGLDWAPSAPWFYREPWGETVWAYLLAAPTPLARLSIIAEFLAPRPAYLRERSGLARRGTCGLLLAYLLRSMSLAARALRAFWSLRAPGRRV